MSDRYATAVHARAPRRELRSARHRRATARRRRAVWTVGAAGLAVLALIVLLPTVRKAINEFGLPLQYQDIIRQQAAAKHLDPALVAGVIDAETKFMPSTSPAGAVGLMQIEPQTAEFLARRSGAQTFTISDLGTPQVNISYGCYYLRYLLDEYGGNESLALAAYNGGETNVNHWLAEARADQHSFVVNDIPFTETRNYVVKVEDLQRRYRQRYATELGYR